MELKRKLFKNAHFCALWMGALMLFVAYFSLVTVLAPIIAGLIAIVMCLIAAGSAYLVCSHLIDADILAAQEIKEHINQQLASINVMIGEINDRAVRTDLQTIVARTTDLITLIRTRQPYAVKDVTELLDDWIGKVVIAEKGYIQLQRHPEYTRSYQADMDEYKKAFTAFKTFLLNSIQDTNNGVSFDSRVAARMLAKTENDSL